MCDALIREKLPEVQILKKEEITGEELEKELIRAYQYGWSDYSSDSVFKKLQLNIQPESTQRNRWRRISDYRYMIFCANVYSGINFDEGFCRAGFMLRDQEDSGKIMKSHAPTGRRL